MTFKLPDPTAWLVQGNYATMSNNIAEHHAVNGEPVEPLYTAQAIKDVLEQAAQMCEEKHWTWHMGDTSGPKECAIAIRKMIGEIK